MKRYSNALLLPTAEAYQSRSKLLNIGTVLATSTKLQDKSALQQLKARIYILAEKDRLKRGVEVI
jgi:hypothetical protein